MMDLVTSALKAPLWLKVLVITLLAGLAAVTVLSIGVDRSIKEARTSGANAQKAEDLKTIIERVEQAHAVQNDVSNPHTSAAFSECVQSSRTPENCQRLLPADKDHPLQPGS